MQVVGRPKLPDEKKKDRFVNVALDDRTYDDFATACDLRGITKSGFIRQHIVQLIREERERAPEAFVRDNVTALPTKKTETVIHRPAPREKKRAAG